MNKQIFFIFCFLIFSIFLRAQYVFTSQMNEKLFQQTLSKVVLNEFESQYDIKINGFPFTIKLEHDKVLISDIGLSIFKDSVSQTNSTINKFIERELLNYLLNPSSQNRNIEDKVSVLFINQRNYSEVCSSSHIFNVIHDLSSIEYSYSNKQYNVKILNSQHEAIEVNFPANYSIILGLDKYEADRYLFYTLKNSHPIQNRIQKLNNSKLYNKKKNVFFINEDYYVLPEINNSLFFENKNDTLVFLFNKEYPEESLQNLVLSGLENENIISNISIKGYNLNYELQMNWKTFLNHFYEFHDPFFGLELITDSICKGVLVLYNEQLNYIHLCEVKISMSSIYSQVPVLNIIIYPFIPKDNIKDFWGVETDKIRTMDNINE